MSATALTWVPGFRIPSQYCFFSTMPCRLPRETFNESECVDLVEIPPPTLSEFMSQLKVRCGSLPGIPTSGSALAVTELAGRRNPALTPSTVWLLPRLCWSTTSALSVFHSPCSVLIPSVSQWPLKRGAAWERPCYHIPALRTSYSLVRSFGQVLFNYLCFTFVQLLLIIDICKLI